MPTRPRAHLTPDLFASLPAAKAPERPGTPPARTVESQDPATRPRPLLPKDLAGALTRLGDTEVDALLAAVTVTAEARRRGRPAPASTKEPKAEATSRVRRSPPEVGAASLTTGKLNAVRAAFKAGVKPAAIARQFGISQAHVKKALAGESKPRR